MNCLNFKMRKLTRLLTRIYDSELSKAGLKTTQFTLLCHVLGYGPAKLGDIAQRMGLEQSTLSRNIRPLVDAGWITYSFGTDARQRLLSLTGEGRSKQAEAVIYWNIAQEKIKILLGSSHFNQLDLIVNTCMDKLHRSDPTLSKDDSNV